LLVFGIAAWLTFAGRSRPFADCIGMTRLNASAPLAFLAALNRSVYCARLTASCLRFGAALLLTVIAVALGSAAAQTSLNVLGAGTPVRVDSGDPSAIVLGVRIFSDVPGKVLGCSFYKAPANTGVHVVSLWDSAGKLLASQAATGETASGKQSVVFATPVAVAANQVFICGYFAPNGHYSHDLNVFTVQKDVPPLHVPASGGVYMFGTQMTAWPIHAWEASNYWVDVLFAPSTGSSTWISGAKATVSGNTANVSWTTAAPADSQVEYGPTAAYGNTTVLAPARVAAHSIALSGLSPGTAYHFRVRSRDSDAVLAIGLDNSLTTAMAVSISTTPLSATIVSGGTQQFAATVGNTANPAVTWSATSGTVNASGLFTAPTVSAGTLVTVTAISQADPSKASSAVLTVNPPPAVLTVSPAGLSFSGQLGAAPISPSSVSITNTGTGALAFTGLSDQPWLLISSASGNTPSTLVISPSIAALKAAPTPGMSP
jgi:hypothetical protein